MGIGCVLVIGSPWASVAPAQPRPRQPQPQPAGESVTIRDVMTDFERVFQYLNLSFTGTTREFTDSKGADENWAKRNWSAMPAVGVVEADRAAHAVARIDRNRAFDGRVDWGRDPIPMREQADNETLKLSAGFFHHNYGGQNRRERGYELKSLRIIGAGRDRTVVRFDLNTMVHGWADPAIIAISDCTIDCNNTPALRSNQQIYLKNVRLMNYSSGAGGSNALFAANRCVGVFDNVIFDGSRGRNPGNGKPTDFRCASTDRLPAIGANRTLEGGQRSDWPRDFPERIGMFYFRDCEFRHNQIVLGWIHEHYTFDRCRFIDIPHRRFSGGNLTTLFVRGCTYQACDDSAAIPEHTNHGTNFE